MNSKASGMYFTALCLIIFKTHIDQKCILLADSELRVTRNYQKRLSPNQITLLDNAAFQNKNDSNDSWKKVGLKRSLLVCQCYDKFSRHSNTVTESFVGYWLQTSGESRLLSKVGGRKIF